jgi:hypothetical protein
MNSSMVEATGGELVFHTQGLAGWSLIDEFTYMKSSIAQVTRNEMIIATARFHLPFGRQVWP